MISRWPTLMTGNCDRGKPLTLASSLRVQSWRTAMNPNVSPDLTMYSEGRGLGVRVGRVECLMGGIEFVDVDSRVVLLTGGEDEGDCRGFAFRRVDSATMPSVTTVQTVTTSQIAFLFAGSGFGAADEG